MLTSGWLAQREHSTAAAIKLIRWIALRLGRRPARALLYPISLYYLVKASSARHHSRRFLGRVLGRPARLTDVIRHIHSFSSVILDRVFLLSGREDQLAITVHGVEHLDRAQSLGRGVLLVGSHLGSFEVLRTLAITRKHYPIKVLMHSAHNALISRLLEELNPQVAASVIDVDKPDALLEAHDALAGGALVGLLADRAVNDRAMLHCPFLGDPAPLPTGPMRFAAVTGAPMVLFFGLYDGGNRYRIVFEPLSDGGDIPRADRPAWVATQTRAFAARLEHHARQAPFNWFNFYDFWA